jgi:membrane protein YqaA with SNARE-associated domain
MSQQYRYTFLTLFCFISCLVMKAIAGILMMGSEIALAGLLTALGNIVELISVYFLYAAITAMRPLTYRSPHPSQKEDGQSGAV